VAPRAAEVALGGDAFAADVSLDAVLDVSDEARGIGSSIDRLIPDSSSVEIPSGRATERRRDTDVSTILPRGTTAIESTKMDTVSPAVAP
jgi:hypothetical protein